MFTFVQNYKIIIMNAYCPTITNDDLSVIEKYKKKYPQKNSTRIQIFMRTAMGLTEDPNINFNYYELLKEGKIDTIIEIVHSSLNREAEIRKLERLIPTPCNYTTGAINSIQDVVTTTIENGNVIFTTNNTQLSKEEVSTIIDNYINANNIEETLANNLRSNIQTAIELQYFARYLAESKFYNSFESDALKSSEQNMAKYSIARLNGFAERNDGLREIRANRSSEESKKSIKTKSLIQVSHKENNGYVDMSVMEQASSSEEAYKKKSEDNINNTDATIIICPCNPGSPAMKATRSMASKANNNGISKIAGDVQTKKLAGQVNKIIEHIIKNLSEREDLNSNEGVSLNITGDDIVNLDSSDLNQEIINDLVYKILKRLQNKGIKISRIVSGGQTGVEQAAVVAAAALKIPYSLHIPVFKSNKGTFIATRSLSGKYNTTLYRLGKSGQLDDYLARFEASSISRYSSKKSNSDQNTQETQSTATNNEKTGNLPIGTSNAVLEVLNKMSEQLAVIGSALNGKQTEGQQTSDNTDKETNQPQDLNKEKEEEKAKKVEESTSKIRSEVTDVHSSPVAKLHKVIGKGSPQKILNRMNMFALMFSQELDAIVETYKEEQYRLSEEAETEEERQEAYFNYLKASDTDNERSFILSKTGNKVIEMMKERIQQDIQNLEDSLVNEEITQERYEYRKNQYQICLDHFDTIFNLASTLIERQENCKIKQVKGKMTIDHSSEKQDLQENTDFDNTEGKPVSGNDAFGFELREIDPHTRLSLAVKKLLRNIPKTINNEDGGIEEVFDDLGFSIYHQEDMLYAILIKEFSKIKEPVDFCLKYILPDGSISYTFPILEALSEKYDWIQYVQDMLLDSLTDPNTGKTSTRVISQFYSNFRNDFIPYFIIKNGVGFISNMESAVNSTLENAVTNFEHGNVLSTHSIYNSTLEINKNNIEYWSSTNNGTVSKIDVLKNFVKSFKEYDKEDNTDSDTIRKNILDIVDLFKSIGLEYSYSDIYSFINTDLGQNLLVDAIGEALKIMVGAKEHEDKTHLTRDYENNYKNIGKYLDKVFEEYVQQSFREGEKTRYSYSTPNYIDTQIKYLNNPDIEERRFYLLKTFSDYGWFYENGKWKNEVLQRLWDGEKIAYNDSVDLLKYGENEYTDWTPDQVSAAFFTSYLNYRNDPSAENRLKALYNFPIFADSPICKLVTMRRYIGKSGIVGSTFKSELLDKLLQIGEQELWRMKLVEQRRNGKNVKPIANFDSRGSKFCFFPSLNKMTAKSLLQYIEENNLTITVENEKLRKDLIARAKIIDPTLDFLDEDDLMSGIQKAYKAMVKEGINNLANKLKGEDTSLIDLLRIGVSEQNDTIKQEILKVAISENIETNYKKFIANNKAGLIKALKDATISGKLDYRPSIDGGNISDYDNVLQEYFWNSTFATANIIQLTTTDLAFYKNGVDFQKRYKEVYVPGIKLNTQSQYGKTIEKTVYLKDRIMTVPTYDYLKVGLQRSVDAKKLSNTEMQTILDVYRNITQTDAQAFRSPKSMRDVLDMLGMLTPALEDFFDRVLNATPDNPYVPKAGDYDNIIQIIKPFFFGHDTIADNVYGGNIRVPHQNKNSEFMLLGSLGALMGIMANNKQLLAVNDFMLVNDIDVIQFESAVKVGKQGIVDINWNTKKLEQKIAELGNPNVKDAKSFQKYYNKLLTEGSISSNEYNSIMENLEASYTDVYNTLEFETMDGGKLNPEVVHEHRYDDYMIATATSEHFFDTEAVYGSQFRNLIISDINPNSTYIVNGKVYSGKELKEHYKKLITDNLLDSFSNARSEFDTIEKLQAKLLKTIHGNPRYGEDIEDALTIVKDAEGNSVFNIPLHNPSTTGKIQELLNSVWKSEVTKQKIKGGAGILVSDFGYSDRLKVVRNEDGSIKEVQCYMPAYAQKFYEHFMDENGVLNYRKIEDECPELLKAVGTRIPTEGKYSMLNLKIVGFLPKVSGGAVILPAEITATAGSDFDVDKIFLQFPAFKVKEKINSKEAWEAFYKDPENSDIVTEINDKMARRAMELSDYGDNFSIADFRNTLKYVQANYKDVFKINSKRELSDRAVERFSYWIAKHNKEFLDGVKFEKITYDPNKNSGEQSRDARNNELIDIALSILSHPDHATHFSNPGSFNRIKKAAKITEILEDKKLRETYMKEKGLNKTTIKDAIRKASLEDIEEFLDDFKEDQEVLSVDTFVYNHVQNMTGAALIGVYANNNSMQAKFQDSGLKLKEQYTFKINGRHIENMSGQETQPNSEEITELISKNCAEWLAASVDNVKDPVLAILLQNPNMANITGFMIRAGLTIEEVAYIFKNPVVKYIMENNEGELTKEGIRGFMSALAQVIYEAVNLDMEYELNTNTLLDMIMSDSKKLKNFMELSPDKAKQEAIINANYLKNIYGVAQVLNKIVTASEYLGTITQCCRADSPAGNIGRTLYEALNKKIRLKNLKDYMSKKNFPFEGLSVVPNVDFLEDHELDAYSNIESIRKALYNAGDGMMLQAFTTLGIMAPIDVMSRWFKPFSNNVIEMVAEVARNHDNKYGTVKDEVLEDIFSDLTTFLLSNTTMFGDDGTYTYEQKRDYYLYEFPKKFISMMQSSDPIYAEIKNLDIIKRLKVFKGEIVMNKGINLTPTVKTLLRQSFDSLLYMQDPIAEQLATDLFAYAYYSKGFKFNSFDYAQFFSTTFLNTVGESALQELREFNLNVKDGTNFPMLDNFREQLYMNRLKEIAYFVHPLSYDNEILKKVKNNENIELPINLVYNNHTKNIISAGKEKSSVFPRILTLGRYYILDLSKGDGDGISLETGKVHYTCIKRFIPEQLSKRRFWTQYNANRSASYMAEFYVKNYKELKERLKRNKKIFSNSKSKLTSNIGQITSNINKTGTSSDTLMANMREEEKAALNTVVSDVEVMKQNQNGLNLTEELKDLKNNSEILATSEEIRIMQKINQEEYANSEDIQAMQEAENGFYLEDAEAAAYLEEHSEDEDFAGGDEITIMKNHENDDSLNLDGSSDEIKVMKEFDENRGEIKDKCPMPKQ